MSWKILKNMKLAYQEGIESATYLSGIRGSQKNSHNYLFNRLFVGRKSRVNS